jgi:hypothetical protein
MKNKHIKHLNIPNERYLDILDAQAQRCDASWTQARLSDAIRQMGLGLILAAKMFLPNASVMNTILPLRIGPLVD